MPSEDKELKSCPFCNGDVKLESPDDISCFIRCLSCEIRTDLFPRSKHMICIARWNTRSKPQDPCCGKKIVLPSKRSIDKKLYKDDTINDFWIGFRKGFDRAIDLCQQAINQQGCGRGLSLKEVTDILYENYGCDEVAEETAEKLVNLQDTKLKGDRL